LSWSFTTDRPIYVQLMDIIRKGILAGTYLPGASLPGVRSLALEAGVNPNTMQKALSELESQGLLFSQRTSGRTVTTDERLIARLRDGVATDCVEMYFNEMMSLGYDRDQAIEVFWSKANGFYDAVVAASAPGVTATAGAGKDDEDREMDDGV